MKNIDIEVVNALTNHYAACVKFILAEQKEENRDHDLADLYCDFIYLMDELEEAKTLEDINLEVDRPITYYCYHCDLEELKDFFKNQN